MTGHRTTAGEAVAGQLLATATCLECDGPSPTAMATAIAWQAAPLVFAGRF